ncbi:MAG: secretion protein HlyD, partial [Planctomycetes bacterium]|nr:secretion protein HlyD [Planctomycetota bacterium]
MSVAPDPQTQATLDLIEKTNQEINFLVEEVARLAEKDISPVEFFGEFLKRVLTVLVAPAGAVWLRTPQGHLQLQYQINMAQVGLDKDEAGRQSHDELLRQGLKEARPGHFPPHSSAGAPDGGVAAGNPTDYAILLAPILAEDQQVSGIVEVWQTANRHPKAVRGFVQFLVRMAGLASRYLRNHQLRQIIGQQQIWTQLEGFTRQVHGSLHTTEVAYLIANEGRRLVECDRISVAVRSGSRVAIEAISGADVVEKRSSLVQLMRALCESVLKWGEKLVYSGTKDDSLPPNVLKALDAFLAESHSKLLVILPL